MNRSYRLLALVLALVVAVGWAVPALAARSAIGSARTPATARTAAGFRYAPGGTEGYARTVLNDGPVGYWRLGEASGTVVNDLSGHTNTGVYTGGVTLGQPGALAVEPDGTSNTAMSFSGTYADVPYSSSLGFTGSFSIACWLYKTADASFARFLTRGTAASALDDWGFITNGGGAVSGFISRVSAEDTLTPTSSVLALNTWYHLAMTYDGAHLRLYVNGVEQGSGTAASGAILNRAGDIYIGHSPGGGAVSARLDEAEISSGSALSAARIQAHYNAGLNQNTGSDVFPTRSPAVLLFPQFLPLRWAA